MERKTPLQLLEPNNYDDISFISRNWGVLTGSFVGGFASVVTNWMLRRPTFSGLPRTILIIAGIGAAGKFVQDYRDEQLAYKDAIMRDYISKHPELFEQPPRQKYSEVFWPWRPMR